jgi:hypothetical protein
VTVHYSKVQCPSVNNGVSTHSTGSKVRPGASDVNEATKFKVEDEAIHVEAEVKAEVTSFGLEARLASRP